MSKKHKKTIAFFGDSFCGQYDGWIESYCKQNNLQCIHIGKRGGDPLYVLNSWLTFHNSFPNPQQHIDYCIYFHTESSRIYHPSPKIGLTTGVIEAVSNRQLHDPNLNPHDPMMKAARDYNRYLNFPEIVDLKNVIASIAADRIIGETNRLFNRVIQFWSFAPVRRHEYKKSRRNGIPISEWPYRLRTGTEVILDLANLSIVEPGNPNVNWDTRPLHFSEQATEFMHTLLDTAINSDRALDFRNYVDENSVWEDYVRALEQIQLEMGPAL